MDVSTIQPILLGSEFNTYGMARSFYDAYGVKSKIYASFLLAPTKYSKIVEPTLIDNFNNEEVFIKTLRDLAKTLDPAKNYFLIACGDDYADLIIKYLDELSESFICPYVNEELKNQLANKAQFYGLCEKYNLPYPKTLIITQEMLRNPQTINIPFEFPIVLKPASSVAWLDIQFEGRKKAYIFQNRTEFEEILAKIAQTEYKDQMICQEFIPGNDSNMRVLNAYVDHNHKVQMMCLGHPLLEDPRPATIGNYMVIMPDYNEELYQQIEGFLNQINYTGFANFDLKYDVRDGKYKLFEINLRQGRSSFYCTLGGYNLAECLVNDYVLNKTLEKAIYGMCDKVWLGVPKSIFEKYVIDDEYKEMAREMIKKGQYGTTVFYNQDKSMKHKFLMIYVFMRFKKHYREYFIKK